MGKVRLYELAKKLNMSSKELLKKLALKGKKYPSHFVQVEEEEVMKSLGLSRRKEEKKEKKEKETSRKKKLHVPEGITVREYAEMVGVSATEIIKRLMELGEMLTITQSMSPEAIEVISDSLGYEVEITSPYSEEEAVEEKLEGEEAELAEKPPVVTVMGHVDHGKTTLLDTIRKTDIAMREHGGITQHIGAYQVKHDGKMITFIDTPGHEAFTAMRARGAKITDIAVLVVAADDGVMPQTIEAIDHAKAAGVPIIVAINKIDKPNANPDKVKQQLVEYGLVPEEWGGDTIFVPISAKLGENINELLEMILLVAEVQELKANPRGRARGVVIEAKLDRGRGPVATILVEKGTFSVGDAVVAGLSHGKIRALINDRGEKVEKAGPGTPVEILGLSSVPEPGNELFVVKDEKEARKIAEERALKLRVAEASRRRYISLEELFKKAKEGEVQTLNLIIKADVQGSLEAVRDALSKIKVEKVNLNIIRAAVGGITEADVMLAAASDALIIGFNVRPDPQGKKLAAREGVEIRTYKVIYQLIEEMEAALKGMLAPEFEEVDIGRVEVRKVFKISRVGVVAGCFVVEGKITRNAQVRLVREGKIIYDGKVASLRRFKDDVSEVKEGYECGVRLENFQDIKVGDLIEVYEVVEKKPS